MKLLMRSVPCGPAGLVAVVACLIRSTCHHAVLEPELGDRWPEPQWHGVPLCSILQNFFYVLSRSEIGALRGEAGRCLQLPDQRPVANLVFAESFQKFLRCGFGQEIHFGLEGRNRSFVIHPDVAPQNGVIRATSQKPETALFSGQAEVERDDLQFAKYVVGRFSGFCLKFVDPFGGRFYFLDGSFRKVCSKWCPVHRGRSIGAFSIKETNEASVTRS